jgi:hypothetical protein
VSDVPAPILVKKLHRVDVPIPPIACVRGGALMKQNVTGDGNGNIIIRKRE